MPLRREALRPARPNGAARQPGQRRGQEAGGARVPRQRAQPQGLAHEGDEDGRRDEEHRQRLRQPGQRQQHGLGGHPGCEIRQGRVESGKRAAREPGLRRRIEH
ncbi:hypothetical protein AEGHOMDF_3604 [Methylobacterium soli]|nr:hypothetical protein AEGHOMDF_3604 [Methylobacterium soli]